MTSAVLYSQSWACRQCVKLSAIPAARCIGCRIRLLLRRSRGSVRSPPPRADRGGTRHRAWLIPFGELSGSIAGRGLRYVCSMKASIAARSYSPPPADRRLRDPRTPLQAHASYLSEAEVVGTPHPINSGAGQQPNCLCPPVGLHLSLYVISICLAVM